MAQLGWLVLALLLATPARAQNAAAPKASLAVAGYAEVFYQWSFNDPSNGITSYRGFDNRHNAFTISNAVVDALGALGPVSARLALQVGHTPDSYYAAEPDLPGGGGAGATGAAVWKYLQQAILAYKAPLGRGLLVEGGIFLSPIGAEGLAIKDQWSWSRSNLFFALPFYHTGFRLSYPFTSRWTVTVAVFNGWNSVVDNNREKSLMAQTSYTTDTVTWKALYFTGVERAPDAAEGRAWRHLFDSHVTLSPRKWLSLVVHADGGFEPNALGTAGWLGGALATRFQPLSWLYLAARCDFFYEWVPSTPIFFPASWVSSATVTADFRPADNVSFRLEFRHDQAESSIYFSGAVVTDVQGGFIANARQQDTLTIGMTAWF